MTDSVQAVIVDEEVKKFLLIKRKGYHDRKFLWRLVKGGKNQGEDDLDALKREIKEETGMNKFQVIGKIFSYSFIMPSNNKVNVNTYLVFGDVNQKLMKEDVEEHIIDYKWVSADTAVEILHYNEEKLAVKKAREFLGW